MRLGYENILFNSTLAATITNQLCYQDFPPLNDKRWLIRNKPQINFWNRVAGLVFWLRLIVWEGEGLVDISNSSILFFLVRDGKRQHKPENEKKSLLFHFPGQPISNRLNNNHFKGKLISFYNVCPKTQFCPVNLWKRRKLKTTPQ